MAAMALGDDARVADLNRERVALQQPQRPFPAFDLIRVVNLPARTDRRREMERELRRVGLAGDPRVAFVAASAPDTSGPFHSRGALGCYLSHLGILREAAALNRSVLILEDDADFVDLPAGYPANCPGIFYGGYLAPTSDDLHASDIIGSHCMGFSAAVAQALVPYLEHLLANPPLPSIDGSYVWFRRAHPDVPTEFAVPPVAVQRPSRTDIGRLRFFDRWPVLRQAVGQARRVKRRIRF